MTRLTKIVLVIFVLFCVALWSPWLQWRFDFFQSIGIKNANNSASLTINSLAGELEVYVDNQLANSQVVTPENSPFTLTNQIAAGEHHVRVVRKSKVAGAFWEYNQILKFVAGYDVNVAWELGPSADFSAGHVIYIVNQTGADKSRVKLELKCNVAEAEISLDGVRIATCPLQSFDLALDKSHEIEVKAAGYESQTFSLLPEDANYRATLAGKTLAVEVYLFRQPLPVVDQE
jgi:hypothetical protein